MFQGLKKLIRHSTGQWPVGRTCYLTVTSTAWKYLYDRVDPASEMLVMTWGRLGVESAHRWSIHANRRSDIPPAALDQGVTCTLRDFQILVVQPRRLSRLDGRTLKCNNDQLIVC